MADTGTHIALIRRTLVFVATILWNIHLVSGGDASRCPQQLPYTTKMAAFRDKCYQFVSVERFWDDARDHCWANGGSLVSIPDSATNEFIVSTLNSLPWSNNGVWMGLHDRNTELVWEWVTNVRGGALPLTFSNWDNDHPGAWFHSRRDCVRMGRDGGRWRWHETVCGGLKFHYRFICQYTMTPLTTTESSVGGLADSHRLGHLSTTESTQSGHQANIHGVVPDSKHLYKYSTDTPPTQQHRFTITKLLKPDAVQSHNAVAPMQHVATEESSNNNIVFVLVGLCIGVVTVVIVLALLIVRRRRRKNTGQEVGLVGVVGPKYDNPLYGGDPGSEGGVAQALLSANHTRNSTGCPPRDYPAACGNVYVSPEEMQGTAAAPLKVLEDVPVSDSQRDSLYLAPVEARRPLPQCPQEEEMDEALKAAGVGGYMPVSSTESLNSPLPGYLPMNGSRRGSRDSLDGPPHQLQPTAVANTDNGGDSVGFAYDTPKPSHIYAEIPFDEKEENIYEALDDLKH